MSTTLTPFLFQTSTLAKLQRRISIVQSRELRRTFCSGVVRRVHAKRDETTNTSSPLAERKGPTIRRTTIMRAEPRFSGGIDGKYSGSQKHEAGQQPSITRRVYDSKDDHGLSMPWGTQEITDDAFEDIDTTGFYDVEDDLFDNDSATDLWTRHSDPSQDRKTTITATERAAFEAIFKNIRSKTVNARKYGGLDEQATDNATRSKAKDKLEGIMGKSTVESLPQTRDEKETVVNRYPPSLRALASRAVGLDYDESRFEEHEKEEDTLDNDQLEELRRPIREEVEAKMRAAKTDSELWDIMEKEVFPMVEKLNLERDGKEKGVLLETKHPVTTKAEPPETDLLPKDENAVQFDTIVHMDREVSPLAFYGPLYPSHLLLGLRLLDRSFTQPSPLTLSILPKIKSLGLTSHVLGASTQLYNELLIVHWYRYDDFRGVIKLLSEMEDSGLAFNRETMDIISDIVRMQGRILRGERGPTLMALWRLPEFAPGKFTYWHKKIRKMVEEEVDSAGQLSY